MAIIGIRLNSTPPNESDPGLRNLAAFGGALAGGAALMETGPVGAATGLRLVPRRRPLVPRLANRRRRSRPIRSTLVVFRATQGNPM